MREALIITVLAAAWVAMFAFTYWWTRLCIRWYRRSTR